MRRVRFAATAAFVIAAVAACSKSPEKVADEARQTAGSWGATVSAAAERWGNGEVSTRFFESVVTQARDALQIESQTARQAAGESAAAPVDAVSARVNTIVDAVRRGDRQAAVAAAQAAASSVAAEKTPAVARPR
jgi:hypothetical protein